jgi:hypothetical protein
LLLNLLQEGRRSIEQISQEIVIRWPYSNLEVSPERR